MNRYQAPPMQSLRPSRCIAVCRLALLGCLTAAGGSTDSHAAAAPPSAPPYGVGNTTFFIHDPSRGFDEAAGVKTGVRTLITELWYPVVADVIDALVPAHGNGGDRSGAAAPNQRPNRSPLRRATYGDYVFGNRAVHRLMMTRTTFLHLTVESAAAGVTGDRIDAAIAELFTRERGSFVDAPVATEGSPFPVIVMSHGDAGSRYNMQTVCEHLAAHGYVVIAPEHTGNSPFSMSGEDPALDASGGDPEFRARMQEVLAGFNEYGTYGPLDNHGQSYTPLAADRSSLSALRALDAALLQRIADLRATLDELHRLNREGRFAGVMDLDRIGLMGRSFGASTVLSALPLEPRFLAGAAVAPPALPDPRPGLPAEALVPPGRESAILSAAGTYGPGTFKAPTLLLMGAEDRLIIGIAAARAEATGTRKPSAGDPFPVLRNAFETSTAPAVWALLENANHASFGVSGDYWWPQLKPREFTRYFDAQATYRRVEPGLAHRIQADKVLAFFDLFVREDSAARERLVANDFESAGLALEHRNF